MPCDGASLRRTLRGMTESNTWKWRLHFVGDLVGEVVARVEHREDDALDLELRVHPVLHAIDRRHEVGEPLERVVLALERHEHAVGRGERVHREEPERRRAVDEDVLVARLRAAARRARPSGAWRGRGRRRARARRRRGPASPARRRARHSVGTSTSCERRAADEAVVDAPLDACAAGRRRRELALPCGSMSSEERSPLGGGDARGEVHRGRRLADAALLVHDGDDAGGLRRALSRRGSRALGAGRPRAPHCAIAERATATRRSRDARSIEPHRVLGRPCRCRTIVRARCWTGVARRRTKG